MTTRALNAALCDALGRVRLRIHPRRQRLITGGSGGSGFGTNAL